jgi:hypothetical protein
MTLKRLLLLACLTALLGTAAFVAREAEGPGLRMTAAAEKFLANLNDAQKKKATFDFDDEERYRWFFTPQQKAKKATRKGVPLSEMSEKQQELARALLSTGTSEAGFKKATAVMSLESILHELESKRKGGGGIVRDPAWYFFTLFGTPSKAGKWGWRVEGHHLSLNFTLDGGKVVAATPFFLGANPAEVKAGPHKGQVTLPESLKPYHDLVAALTDEQRKTARDPKMAKFKEIEEEKSKPTIGAPIGLKAKELSEKQKALLWKLIEGYAQRMPEDVAAYELAQVKKAGLDEVHFAYAINEKAKGSPFKYRVQGPTFVIEFVNEQSDSAGNPANHIHSSWRNIKGDFGLAAR